MAAGYLPHQNILNTMENDELVLDETLDVPEVPAAPTVSLEESKKDELIENYKARAEKAERERKALETRLNASKDKTVLDVEDYIDISASLEGLDQRQKEYLAEQHKLSGKALKEIRATEDFQLWNSAYTQKVEKERLSLKPSSTQPDAEMPKSFEQKLSEATTMAEKEKMLIEAGLYRNPQGPRADRQYIGTER